MTMPSPLLASSYVALGGAIGSLLRYQAGRGMTRWLGAQAVTAFPWATLTVNVVGSLAMGLLAGWLARHGQGGEQWRLFLGPSRNGTGHDETSRQHDELNIWLALVIGD